MPLVVELISCTKTKTKKKQREIWKIIIWRLIVASISHRIKCLHTWCYWNLNLWTCHTLVCVCVYMSALHKKKTSREYFPGVDVHSNTANATQKKNNKFLAQCHCIIIILFLFSTFFIFVLCNILHLHVAQKKITLRHVMRDEIFRGDLCHIIDYNLTNFSFIKK